ncbi:MAG: type II secretion system protein [Desulfobacteraceae bacterium]|jgi:MSHA pilin protein MshC
MRQFREHRYGGFTLLEILAVMVLIGIFVVLALIQHSTSDASLMAQAQVLKSHVRYAQMRSINSDTRWGIYYNHNSAAPGDCYYLLFRDDTSNVEQLPGETDDRVRLGEMGITISSEAAFAESEFRSFSVAFDDWGKPSSDELGTGSYAITLTKSGHDDAQFVITQNTGFID